MAYIDHLFIPELIPYARTVNASKKENRVEYETRDGVKFKNGKANVGNYTPRELNKADDLILGNPNVEEMRQVFDAKVVG